MYICLNVVALFPECAMDEVVSDSGLNDHRLNYLAL